ncbi:MAG: DeoR/GlpR family DNA-binding transcription regulator [Firmicutes bacterium]|nr:DeoR/GlpR family DNA-binding transcription regulator [Bacillota bacterium]
MTYKRRRALLQLLEQQPDISVQELTQALGVSPATVRRDLATLAAEGVVQRVRGGAVLQQPVAYDEAWKERRRHQVAEKQAIALAAADLIDPGLVVALDVGSTTYFLAEAIRQRSDLVVFTASLPHAQVLGQGNCTTFLVGGHYRPKEQSLTGTIARQVVQQYHYDLFFLGASAWSLEQGVMDFSMDDVDIKRVFMEQSTRVIAVLDSSKYGRTSLTSIAPLDALDMVITDDGLDPQLLDTLQEQVDVKIVPARRSERRLG